MQKEAIRRIAKAGGTAAAALLLSCSVSKAFQPNIPLADTLKGGRMDQQQVEAPKSDAGFAAGGAKEISKSDVYSKADSGREKMELSVNARKLARQRIKEIDSTDLENSIREQRDYFSNSKPETKEEHREKVKALIFSYGEKDLYVAALTGKTYQEIEKCKEEIVETGKLFKDIDTANRIISDFNRIISTE